MTDHESRARVRAGGTGPGPGVGVDRDPERAASVVARIIIVATIVAGQLWALAVMLNAYLSNEMRTVWWLLGFEVASFAVAFAVWWVSAADR